MPESQEEYVERLKYRLAHPQPGDRTPRPGMVARADETGAGLVDVNRARQERETTTETVRWDIPKIKKRTDQERAISLANRLFTAVKKRQPAEMDYVLREFQIDKWKSGEPISFEDCQTWAAGILRKAAAMAEGN